MQVQNLVNSLKLVLTNDSDFKAITVPNPIQSSNLYMGHQSISTRIPDHTCMNLVSRHDQSTCLHTILVHDLVGCIASFPGSHPELEREPGNIGGIKLWTSGNVIIRVTKEDTPLPEVIFM